MRMIMNGIIQNTLRIHKKATKLPRCISVSFSSKQNEKEKPNECFVPIYKFPYILPFSVVNRLKAYHTVLSAISVPVAIGLNQLNYIPSGAVEYTASLGVSGCIALYSLGYLTQNFIGFIYYNDKQDMVKISYIDFWGKRKDIEVPAKDIIPLSELPFSPLSGLFLNIRRFSTPEILKLNLQFGIILHRDKIKQIL